MTKISISRKKTILKGRVMGTIKSKSAKGRTRLEGVTFRQKGYPTARPLFPAKSYTVKGIKESAGKVKYKNKYYYG